jgi:hypothetical protein
MLAPSTSGVHGAAAGEIQNAYDSQCGFPSALFPIR